MSEQQAAEAATTEDGPEGSEPAPTATAVIERPLDDEAPSADETATSDEPADEPAAAADEVVVEETPASRSAAVRTARIFLCECGYRTVAIWGDPQTCQAQRSRRGEICGKPLYAVEHVPDKVQKALNPLKASKKKAKGSD